MHAAALLTASLHASHASDTRLPSAPDTFARSASSTMAPKAALREALEVSRDSAEDRLLSQEKAEELLRERAAELPLNSRAPPPAKLAGRLLLRGVQVSDDDDASRWKERG